MNWERYCKTSPVTPSYVLSQFLCNKSVHFQRFSTKNINFVTQLFHSDGTIKNWNDLKTEFALQNKDHFSWLQLVSIIPEI